MKIISSRDLDLPIKNQLFTLWNSEYPSNLVFESVKDLDDYLISLQEKQYYLLIDNIGQLVGWACIFLRENENWFAILIDGKIQGNGFGKLLLDELKKVRNNLNGWVIDHNDYTKSNGVTYYSPLPFYLKNDFLVLQKLRLENHKISAVKINWTQSNFHF